jgi:hypothetical protein
MKQHHTQAFSINPLIYWLPTPNLIKASDEKSQSGLAWWVIGGFV